jgi:hypothetical protein
MLRHNRFANVVYLNTKIEQKKKLISSRLINYYVISYFDKQNTAFDYLKAACICIVP